MIGVKCLVVNVWYKKKRDKEIKKKKKRWKKGMKIMWCIMILRNFEG